ncbi:snare-domain-containing protein [Dissoconium aciculare CBS 342.82]|jgi:syntaxin 8|uniref:Snare-domain-containing protein n=1 Tax=Dissoconium aciculare CBS 342.82 TaxID=1314786 RepID=A0A6J3MB85_9PEZI|nr:snare-domain-containing protein [Dissoconium aciculare CBS 342.82]KAF1824087.1 snare-domain-containing protein [Dissoconium aciculare CBS 342.82]
MAETTPRQLLLLADRLKLSLLERQHASSRNQDTTQHDARISQTLSQLQAGIAAIETRQTKSDAAEEADSDLARVRKQYETLQSQFSAMSVETSASETADAVQKGTARKQNARFRDEPNTEEEGDPIERANRAALFADQERYQDEPSTGIDHTSMDNQQIHDHHKQAFRDQDEQLEVLGQSIGRQRLLGIQMGNELDEQNELLDDVERGVDRHTSTLERARRRLGHVARKSKANGSWITIGILIIILILVIVILK